MPVRAGAGTEASLGEMPMEKWKEFLRRPGVLASLLCLCVALGFFLGSVYDRRSASPVRVVLRSGAETPPPEIAPVNINTADTAELETLPGIGPTLAGRILEHREASGPFRCLTDLMDVEGIGSAVFEGLEGRITLD